MRYRIPDEVPPGPLARFATRAGSPYWATLIGGFLPSLVWSVANAWFLGCRDARWQTAFALIGYAIVASIGGGNMYLTNSGAFFEWFGEGDRLAHALLNTAYVIGSLLVVRVLTGRQIDLAAYRSTLGRPLPWGFVLIGLIWLSNRFVMPRVYDSGFPEIVWVWGRPPL